MGVVSSDSHAPACERTWGLDGGEADSVAAGNQAEAAVSRLRRIRREEQTRQVSGYQERVREIDREIGEVMAGLNRGVAKLAATTRVL